MITFQICIITGLKNDELKLTHTSILLSVTEAAIIECRFIRLASVYEVFHAIFCEVTFMPCLIQDNYCLITMSHFKLCEMLL